MRSVRRFLAPSLLALLACNAVSSSAGPLKPPAGDSHELGDLVALLLPDPGQNQLTWDYRADSFIKWMDDGYVQELDGRGERILLRRGLARVNVAGATSTVLRRHREELWWSVTYASTDMPKFGPQVIEISPATPRGLPAGDLEQCFGSLYEGCSFQVGPSLKAAGVIFSQICSGRFGSAHIRGFTVSKPGRGRMQLRVTDDSGSGGNTTELDLLFADPSKLCRIN